MIYTYIRNVFGVESTSIQQLFLQAKGKENNKTCSSAFFVVATPIFFIFIWATSLSSFSSNNRRRQTSLFFFLLLFEYWKFIYLFRYFFRLYFVLLTFDRMTKEKIFNSPELDIIHVQKLNFDDRNLVKGVYRKIDRKRV